MNIGQEIIDQLRTAAEELGVDALANLDAGRDFAAESARNLSELVDDPNFAMALRAERDAVALHLGIAAVNLGDAADQRLKGVLQGSLAVLAKVLAAGFV